MPRFIVSIGCIFSILLICLSNAWAQGASSPSSDQIDKLNLNELAAALSSFYDFDTTGDAVDDLAVEEFRDQVENALEKIDTTMRRSFTALENPDDLCAVSELVLDSAIYAIDSSKYSLFDTSLDEDAFPNSRFLQLVLDSLVAFSDTMAEFSIARCSRDTLGFDFLSAFYQFTDLLAAELTVDQFFRFAHIHSEELQYFYDNDGSNNSADFDFQGLDRCDDLEPEVNTKLDALKSHREERGIEVTDDDLALFAAIKSAATKFVPAELRLPESSLLVGKSIDIDCRLLIGSPALTDGVDFFLNDSVLPRGLTLNSKKLGRVSINSIRLRGLLHFERSQMRRLHLGNIAAVGNDAMPEDSEYQWSDQQADISVYGARIETDTEIEHISDVKRINLYTARLGNDARIENISGIEKLLLSSTSGGYLGLDKVVGAEERPSEIQLHHAGPWAYIRLSEISEFKNLEMYSTQAHYIYIRQLEDVDSLNLNSSTANYLFLERSSIEDLTFELSDIASVIGRELALSRMSATSAEVSRLLALKNVVLRDMDGADASSSNEYGLKTIDADQVLLQNICGDAATLDMTSARIGQTIHFEDVDLNRLNLNGVNANGIQFFGPIPKLPDEPKPISTNTPPDNSVEADQIDSPVESKAQEEDQQETPWASCAAQNDFDSVQMVGTRTSELRIAGSYQSDIQLTGLLADRVLFRDNRVAFGEEFELNLRDANIGTLSAPLQGFKSAEGVALPVDVLGSQIEVLKWYEPGRDLPLEEDEEAGRTSSAPQCAFFDCMLSSFRAAVDRQNETGNSTYAPHIFELAKKSATALGMTAHARQISIEKNNAFRAALGSNNGGALFQDRGLQVVYWLGYHINRYGYDNMRAFGWLAVLWLFGVLVLFVPILRGKEYYARYNDASFVPHRPLYRQFFASLDRTIPSLSLDEDFGHTRSLHAWQAVLIYLQRFVAFIVIGMILGGLFNFFQ